MKVLITGSHFTPAQAVIEELKKDPSVEIVYVGRSSTMEGDNVSSLESQVLPKMGVRFIPIFAGRLQRSFTRYTIPSLLKFPIGLIQALWIVLVERPNITLSFGGYVAVPVVICSWLLSIPVMVHEQTLITGLANTISSFFAQKIAISFDQNYSFDGTKVVVTGNPIRREVLFPSKKVDEDLAKFFSVASKDNLPIVLITGGNQGSHVINKTVLGLLDQLTERFCVVHQTGDSRFHDFDKLSQKQKGLKRPDHYLVKKWVSGVWMGQIYQKTSLVISRAGINTLLELAYWHLPTIVIPIPYLHKNEQMVNAKYFERLGLVKILPQSVLAEDSLWKNLDSLESGLDRWQKSTKVAKRAVIKDAAKRLALEVRLLSKE
ncbi:UDP-N-acetylglucosamine--N-acetylmuramyl-(pentapeptide) pyrophosphoryl-undecaprenol N-acetylglucosamine transferase [Candidatus Daviesbacteria bacterium]|nr:UDP-N-acetylglucosamine--N-acetylmuramyl-(pentapeptide) pyrophosphoryl-undecaprenol N-acetylglucosamine transferase [Candidatus Daviesbacteria bacterium]